MQKEVRRREHQVKEGKEQHMKGEGMKAMQPVSEKVVEHHSQPYPQAEYPQVNPFPKPVLLGLLFGVLAGMALGIGLSALLLNGFLVIPGWEGLFSMTPSTFYVFWMVMGAAVMGLIVSIAALISTPVPRSEWEVEQAEDD